MNSQELMIEITMKKLSNSLTTGFVGPKLCQKEVFVYYFDSLGAIWMLYANIHHVLSAWV